MVCSVGAAWNKVMNLDRFDLEPNFRSRAGSASGAAASRETLAGARA
jgi:hypothetical protein